MLVTSTVTLFFDDHVFSLVYPISDHLSDSTTMSTSNTTKMRKARSGCEFTAEERGAFAVHKEEYRSQTTKERRAHIFKTKILPDMFNYWTDHGAVSISQEEIANRVKVCSGGEGGSLLMKLF